MDHLNHLNELQQLNRHIQNIVDHAQAMETAGATDDP